MGSRSVRRSWWIGVVAVSCAVGLLGSPVGATTPGPSTQAAPGGPTAVAIPAPGSATSSPATSITLSGADPSAIGPVSVTGSESGPVAGRTVALARGEGVVFTPDAELVPGETVEVTSSVAVLGADGPAWSFTVATPAPDPGFDLDQDVNAPADRSGRPRAAAPRFVTRPDLRPPGIDINQAAAGTAPGYLFATPGATAQDTDPGVLIYDDSGQPVWFRPDTSDTDVVGDAKVVTFRGAPALVWFEGFAPYGPGSYRGEWVVVDSSYREVARIRMGNGYRADIHDIVFTDRGTAYLMAYNPLTCTGIAPLAGCAPGATVLEGVVQEVDVASGQVLWEWHSLDHVPLSDNYLNPAASVSDYFHINSVDLDEDGGVLVSARSTSALYKLDRTTGEVEWTFGGKSTSFPTLVGNPAGTSGPDYPHDFRPRGGGSYSYYDNGVARNGPSRGHIVTLDPGSGTATFTTNLGRPSPVFSPTQGNMQALPGGGNLVSWGNLGIVTEYDASGDVIFDASFTGTASYRQRRHEWTGAPATSPVAHAAAAPGGTSVAVSWNGDTRTARWRVLAGDTVDSLTPVATVDRSGFETSTVVAGRPARVVVEALDSGGGVLGRSEPVGGGQWFSEQAGPSVSGSYRPLVGDFGGGRNDDVVYYRPGTGSDFLHVADGDGGFASTLLPAVNGDHTPLVGDFLGDDRDEILWTRAGNPYASVWRFDGSPRSGSVSVSSGVIGVPATVTRSLVLDHRPSYGGGYDEVLFYAAGAASDRVVHLTWPAGGGLTQSVRSISVRGSYAPVSGDFDGNGQADVLWYAPGPSPDYLWLTTGDTGRSTGQRSLPKAVNGSYQVSAEDHYGTDQRDEVVFFGSGAGPDTMWVFDDFGSHIPVVEDLDAAGLAIPLQGANASLMTWFPGSSPGILKTDPLPLAHRPSGNGSLGSGYYPIVGDFVGAPGTSSVLWYAAGAAPERLYVGG